MSRRSKPGRLFVGDQVEVLGFPAKGEYTPMLQDADFPKNWFGPLPEPVLINTDEALKGTYDCRLVRIEATVLDRARHSHEQFLVLASGQRVYFSRVSRKEKWRDGFRIFAERQQGCRHGSLPD